MKKKLRFILPIFVFLFINLIFNFSLWGELFGNRIMVSDNIVTEYLIETSYQNILQFKNPFVTKSILYPFTTNFSLNDPNTAYVLPFFIFRPLINSHKSLLIIILFGFFLNNFFMYLLLRKLKIDQYLSILVSLIFGFTPFLSHRVLGHYAYISIYFFPLVFIALKKLFESNKTIERFIFCLVLGLCMATVLLSNFYYFFTIVLGLLFSAGYWFFTDRKEFLKLLSRNVTYLFLSIISAIFFLIPWILSVYNLIKTQGLVKTPGFGGSITLSSDLASFITPSEFNPLYNIIFNKITSIVPLFVKYQYFFLNSLERFSYPGIIIVLIYLTVTILKIFNRFPQKLWQLIKPYFIVSSFFYILMLGPFLKIFNRWFINLDGVSVVLPLPFLLLHYIPGLSTIRATARFTPAFVFFACIVTAYVINFVLTRISKKKQIILLVCLFVIFFFDQFYTISQKMVENAPVKIYQYLKNQNDQKTVLDVPFTVRDGFNYIGFVHGILPMYGQLIHGKPIIGGYLARVPEEVFIGYKNMRFINYIAKIIDKGNYNPYSEKPKEPNIIPFAITSSLVLQELNSLNVKYIILKNNEKYTPAISSIISKVDFKKIMNDGVYDLYERKFID